MICTSIQNKTFDQILEILEMPIVEMAEIRLDRCSLSKDEIIELFSESDTPLIATCRGDSGPLEIAIEAGARFADLEIEADAPTSRRIQKLCRQHGTELIRSFHDFNGTPDNELLQMALARCFRYGADIAKIVTYCQSKEDISRIEALYSIILEDLDSLQGKLIAFGMGEEAAESRIDCLKRGAPFTYASLNKEESLAQGQIPVDQMYKLIYGDRQHFVRTSLKVPSSKSIAQRAIICAALAQGQSQLNGYSPCSDSESAIQVAERLGALVKRDGTTLYIDGIGPINNKLQLERLNVGESGLLTRMMIPILAAINGNDIIIEGEGTLLKRPLEDAASIMAAFGVLLSEEKVPLKVKGRLIAGNADISGKGGSQLISGLLMALPLCEKDSFLYVNDPKSIPYMYMSLDVLRHFGIYSRSEMEGDAQMLEQQDWSSCTGISFKLKGKQYYRSANIDIEGDWSAAANFLVAGAIFGSAQIIGLDCSSIQADLEIIDILVRAGAVVSQLEDGSVCVRKAPLEAFNADLNHAPDLFPIVAILASFCAGESHIEGLGRLSGKESNRAGAILQMLEQMGVEAFADGDIMTICGETLCSRILCGRLLRGGEYNSYHDHRMVMALKVASLGSDSPLLIDDENCVSKSFPDFMKAFE